MIENKYKFWSPWDKLKSVMLGNFYDPHFFSTIQNDFIRHSLSKIAEETLEDLEYFEKVLKDFGCNVIRPKLNHNDTIDRYIEDGKVNYINPFNRVRTVPRSPLQPRDCALVINDKLYITHGDHASIFEQLSLYNDEDQIILDFELDSLFEVQKKFLYERYYKVRKTNKWPSLEKIETEDLSELDELTQSEINYFKKYAKQSMVHLLKAPCMTLIGKDLYIEGALFELNKFKSIDFGTDLRYNIVNEGGHSDGCFAPIKPGALMTVKDPYRYAKSFPNWDICYLPGHAKEGKLMSTLHKWKDKIGGRWYIEGQEINDELVNFINIYLSDLTGFTIETIFDVNCLVLDENHICVSNLIPEVEQFFKKHKIEPIVVPFRHRHFHDGGLHCITLDLYREGEKKDYFPNRNKSIYNPDGNRNFFKKNRGFVLR